MKILLDQLVYFGFFQSIILLLIYLFTPRKRRHINGFMTLLIGTLFVGLLGKVLYNSGIFGQNFRLIAMSEMSALLFGPTVYLFARTTLKVKPYSPQDLLHYLPAVAYSIFIVVYFIIPGNDVARQRASTGETIRVIYICHAVGLIVNITYWALGWQVFKHFTAEIKNEISYELRTKFMSRFLLIIGICLCIWTILYITSFFGFDMLERNARPYIWIMLTLIILFITYFGMVAPQVLRIAPDMQKRKYNQSKLSVADMERLKEKLNVLMLEKKPYLNEKLLKTELAQMLGVNDPELARLLNESIGMNFFDYVNYYRIKEFISLAKTEKAKQLTFYALAQEAGFNSKTTFNKSFKKLIGTSPSVYLNTNF